MPAPQRPMPTEAEVLTAIKVLDAINWNTEGFTLSEDARSSMRTTENNLSWLLRQTDFRSALRAPEPPLRFAGHEVTFSGGGPIDGPDGFVGESVFLQLNGDDVVGLHEGPAKGQVRAYVIDARYEIPVDGPPLDGRAVPVFPVHSSRQDEPELDEPVVLSYRLNVSVSRDSVDLVMKAACEHNETGEEPTTIGEAVQDLFNIPGGTEHLYHDTPDRCYTGWDLTPIVEPKEPTLTIPDHLWKPNEHVSDPLSVLRATIVVSGLPMNFDAWEIVDGDTGFETAPGSDCQDDLFKIHAAVNGYGPFQTTAINGRNYVIIATPHCR